MSMTKRKIIALYPVPASSVPSGVGTYRTWPLGIFALDDQGTAWFTTQMPATPLAFYDWTELPELPD